MALRLAGGVSAGMAHPAFRMNPGVSAKTRSGWPPTSTVGAGAAEVALHGGFQRRGEQTLVVPADRLDPVTDQAEVAAANVSFR